MIINRNTNDIILTEEEEILLTELDAAFSANEPVREHSFNSYWSGSISQSVVNAYESGNYVEVQA